MHGEDRQRFETFVASSIWIPSRFENHASGKIDMKLNNTILRKLHQIAFIEL